MITIAWWQALALAGGVAFAGFLLGVALMAAFVAAGSADDAIERAAAADPRLRVDTDAFPEWQREAIGGEE